jgi:hypothetical protein
MSSNRRSWSRHRYLDSLLRRLLGVKVPLGPLTIIFACVVGVLGGSWADLFTRFVNLVTEWTVEPIVNRSAEQCGCSLADWSFSLFWCRSCQVSGEIGSRANCWLSPNVLDSHRR